MPFYTDELAEQYAANRKNFRATDEEVFSIFENLGVAEKRVLDFGCGDGAYAQWFLDRSATEVVGIDDSEKMIDLAKAKYGTAPKLQFLVADGNNLPFDANSFDLTFAYFVLHHFTDTLPPLQEIYRTLKPDGVLVATMGAYDIPEGADVALNTPAPIRLGTGAETVLVHNMIKSDAQIRADITTAGFTVETFTQVDNPFAKMDETHPYKEIVMLHTLLIVAKK